METIASSVKIGATEETIQKWANRSHIKETTRSKILISNVLFIPDEGYIEDGLLYFPAGTIDLFHYLNENKGKDLEIEAGIEDEDYKELSLHADLLVIAGLIVTNLVAPIVVNLISDYIKDKLGEREKKTTVKARLIVTVEADKRAAEISYEGPAIEYRSQMLEVVSRLTESPHNQLPQLQEPKPVEQGKVRKKKDKKGKKRKK